MLQVSRNNLEEILSFAWQQRASRRDIQEQQKTVTAVCAAFFTDVYRRVDVRLWHEKQGHLRSLVD